MVHFLGFLFCVGLLAHGNFFEDILYDIFIVGVSLVFDSLGWASFFVVGLCDGEMRFEMLPTFLAAGVRFHFSTASAKMCALVMMMVPILMSCSSISGLPWASSMVA